ncbi:hypothetical protein TVNIR_0610 [Thioalkalivibrio nitratireducens DSM 14787]|uniref:Uncharacterized protein n=1 Tax=Thioalkalivibrio nitratireducens (strain DSM 14787 / UNIQEM 213 / ALEN2) TaxID=1255043 RepID=L0DTI8_THIND|nr:hypothetical protein TVNIR_0610 [Thioalkalivibrio nitratireducens DSM 14787]
MPERALVFVQRAFQRTRRQGLIGGVDPVGQHHTPGLEPGLVGATCKFGKHLLLGNDSTAGGIEHEQRTGFQPSPRKNIARGNIQHSGLAGHDQPSITGDAVPAGPQPVPVQHGGEPLPVGGDHQRRPVPGLHQRAVIRIEGAPARVHVLILLFPGLRDQHAQRVRQAASGNREQFQHVIQLCAVAESLPRKRPDFPNVGAEARRCERRLARPHPVLVAAQRVDLSVVHEVTIGVREIPGPEGVGGKTRVHQDHCGGDARIGQVGVIGAQLCTGQQTLVYDRGPGQRADIEDLLTVPDQTPVQGLVLDLAPQHVQRNVQVRGLQRLPGPDEELLRDGFAFERCLPQPAVVRRHRTPCDQVEAALPAAGGDQRTERGPLVHVPGHEHLPDAVAVGIPEAGKLFPEEHMRLLQQHAGPVAGVLLGPARTPMVEVFEAFDTVPHQPMAAVAIEIGDHTHAAARDTDRARAPRMAQRPGQRRATQPLEHCHLHTPNGSAREPQGTLPSLCARTSRESIANVRRVSDVWAEKAEGRHPPAGARDTPTQGGSALCGGAEDAALVRPTGDGRRVSGFVGLRRFRRCLARLAGRRFAAGGASRGFPGFRRCGCSRRFGSSGARSLAATRHRLANLREAFGNLAGHLTCSLLHFARDAGCRLAQVVASLFVTKQVDRQTADDCAGHERNQMICHEVVLRSTAL